MFKVGWSYNDPLSITHNTMLLISSRSFTSVSTGILWQTTHKQHYISWWTLVN